jgi:hypothetical protein
MQFHTILGLGEGQTTDRSMGIMEFYQAETWNRRSKQPPRMIHTTSFENEPGGGSRSYLIRMIEPFAYGIIKAASDPNDGDQLRGIREPISLAIFEASQHIPAA